MVPPPNDNNGHSRSKLVVVVQDTKPINGTHGIRNGAASHKAEDSEPLDIQALLKKALKEQDAKETTLEKELNGLGCVQWRDLQEVTPAIVATVREMCNPERGPFVLKPGLSIVYLSDATF